MQRRHLILGLSAAAILSSGVAFAALDHGQKAPDFTLKAAKDGVVSSFSLKAALKFGPVVVYFYPKAFTGGCSLEAREFSQSMAKFKAKKVTVVGVSADDIVTLQDFSKKDCAGQFSVASDQDLKVTKAYKAQMGTAPMSARISYLIDKKGKIVYVHADANAATHVSSLLAEAEKLK